jgi:tetratricopeptide (TPR) repeat protein
MSMTGCLLWLTLALGFGEFRLAAATQPPGDTPEAIEARNARVASMNTQLAQALSALLAHQWREAETALKQLIEANPDAGQWEFYQALATAQTGLKEYDDAIVSCEKGIALARNHPDPTADPARIKAGVEQMLTAEGNAYLKLNKAEEAIAQYTKAAVISSHPATAWFNVCAALYNLGHMTGAAEAADKAIVADPQKADAYFVKGSALYANSRLEGGRHVAPPESVDALRKYLELAPAGGHADDVKAMLDALDEKPGTPATAGKQ